MEKIDLTKLLKDCPKGMPLDCAIFDNVTLYKIESNKDNEYPIRIETTNGHFMDFTKYGTYTDAPEAKCLIFPKGKTTWEGFHRPFVDGDIVFYNDTVAIFKEWGDETLFRTYVAKGLNCEDLIGINTPLFGKSVRNEIRFATEEEKQILFKALEENRYKWNSKTKSLEKLIAPKFKVGDKIRHKTANIDYVLEISRVYDDSYGIVGCGWMVSMEYQNEYELVPNKFDPKILQPFDKVLVRQYDECWHIQFFETMYKYDKNHPFRCLGGKLYSFCIPYAGNEYLLDTTDEPSEFYKYWEN